MRRTLALTLAVIMLAAIPAVVLADDDDGPAGPHVFQDLCDAIGIVDCTGTIRIPEEWPGGPPPFPLCTMNDPESMTILTGPVNADNSDVRIRFRENGRATQVCKFDIPEENFIEPLERTFLSSEQTCHIGPVGPGVGRAKIKPNGKAKVWCEVIRPINDDDDEDEDDDDDDDDEDDD